MAYFLRSVREEGQLPGADQVLVFRRHGSQQEQYLRLAQKRFQVDGCCLHVTQDVVMQPGIVHKNVSTERAEQWQQALADIAASQQAHRAAAKEKAPFV